MMVGYVRVSTTDQTTQRQVDELVIAGVSPLDIFGDEASGVTMERPGWEACGRRLQEGDILVIHSLDRLSRNLVHTMTTLRELNDRGVTVKVLTMDFDSRTPIGRFVFAMMAGFAQFERDIILGRTAHGLAKARERGVFGGARHKYTDDQILNAYKRAGNIEQAAKLLKCSEPTIKRGLARLHEAKKLEQEAAGIVPEKRAAARAKRWKETQAMAEAKRKETGNVHIDATEQGKAAFGNGADASDNPYQDGTEESAERSEGWHTAERRDRS